MSRVIKIGGIKIGGGNPIAIQSMTNTDTADFFATMNQINELQQAGCDIVRMTVNTQQAADNIKHFVAKTQLPLVADIHFNAEYAIKSITDGISKVRINPQNIGSEQKLKAVVDAAKFYHVPIRVGVNSGSIENDLLSKYGNTAEALTESALRSVLLLEKQGFEDIVISVKSSDVKKSVRAYTLLSNKTDYPLHLGITEAGFGEMAITKSAVGIGSLLINGIGDTIRVSMTGDPIQEVYAAQNILKALDMFDKPYVNIVACPTCGRTEIAVLQIAKQIEQKLSNVKKRLTVAVMGCIVNGLGEGKEADFGVAGGKNQSIIFSKGTPILKVKNELIADELLRVIEENG